MAKPLRLVEKGVLKSYLLTRQPVRGFEGSNGRARLPGNLRRVPRGYQQSVRQLLRNSPCGGAEEEADRHDSDAQQALRHYRAADGFSLVRHGGRSAAADAGAQGGARPVSLPILVYKVFPDGHEELVRGLRFRGFSARSLKDILAAGDDSNVFEFMDNPAPFALIGAASSPRNRV